MVGPETLGIHSYSLPPENSGRLFAKDAFEHLGSDSVPPQHPADEQSKSAGDTESDHSIAAKTSLLGWRVLRHGEDRSNRAAWDKDKTKHGKKLDSLRFVQRLLHSRHTCQAHKRLVEKLCAIADNAETSLNFTKVFGTSSLPRRDTFLPASQGSSHATVTTQRPMVHNFMDSTGSFGEPECHSPTS